MAKHAEVFRKGGCAQVGPIEEFASKVVTLAKRFQNLLSSSMSESAKDIFGAEGSAHEIVFSQNPKSCQSLCHTRDARFTIGVGFSAGLSAGFSVAFRCRIFRGTICTRTSTQVFSQKPK